MIGVLTFLTARPDRLSQLTRLLHNLIAPSLDNPGCLGMNLYSNPQDPCRLMVFEQWASKTDFDVNGALPQFQTFWQQRLDLLEDDIEYQFYNLVSPQPNPQLKTVSNR
jgi:quinol monooxygenase YgiN